MGAAPPLNIATQLKSYALDSVPLDNVEIISAKIIDAPITFTECTRPIQLNGQLLKLALNNKLYLRTAAGPVSIELSAPTQDQLLSLKNILSTPNKSHQLLTILIQPDNPKEATLLVPKNEKLNILRTPLSTNTPVQKASEQSDENFAQGKKLTLTVLPDKIKRSILSSKEPMHITQQLTSNTNERTIEKALGNLHKTVKSAKSLLEKHIASKNLTRESSYNTLTGDAHKQEYSLKQGQELHAKIDRVITHLKQKPNAGISSRISDKLAPNQIKATVIGKSHSNHVILNSREKTLFVKQDGHLPTGTKMILTLTPKHAVKEVAPRLPSDQEWPALRELVSTLQQSNPKMAEQFLQTKIPSPAQNMMGTTLFFINAMQGGKLNEWLGLPVHISLIKENKKELIDKLVTDLTEGSKTASDTRAGEWKSCPIPLHHGQEFDMLRLYVRDQSHNNSQNKARAPKKHTHFVITMNMSRLGSVQMEGFSRPKKLDLVIRSERKLPSELPRSIRIGYTKTMEALGMTGTIIFQIGNKDWVRIEDSKMQNSEVIL